MNDHAVIAATHDRILALHAANRAHTIAPTSPALAGGDPMEEGL